MKNFKIIDAWISVGLMISFTMLICFDKAGRITLLNNRLLTGYFVVGGWQVISMLVHAAGRWFTVKYGIRYFYHWISFIALITMPAGSFWVLVFTAPFMAVFYTGLCFDELRKMNQRPLSILK